MINDGWSNHRSRATRKLRDPTAAGGLVNEVVNTYDDPAIPWALPLFARPRRRNKSYAACNRTCIRAVATLKY